MPWSDNGLSHPQAERDNRTLPREEAQNKAEQIRAAQFSFIAFHFVFLPRMEHRKATVPRRKSLHRAEESLAVAGGRFFSARTLDLAAHHEGRHHVRKITMSGMGSLRGSVFRGMRS